MNKSPIETIASVVVAGVAAAVLVAAGCKALPTPDKMKSAAQAVGAASGLVADETKIDDRSRETVIDVVTLISHVVPTNGQTFADAWAPVVDRYVADLVSKGKLSDAQAALVRGGAAIAASGMDYVFKVYPKARGYEELVSAAVEGFTDGFLKTFRPVGASARARGDVVFDVKAYDYLKARFPVK